MKRPDDLHNFKILPRRLVERTLAWITRSAPSETTSDCPASTKIYAHWAMVFIMTRRAAVDWAGGTSRGRLGALVCCGGALALDVGQAFGELAISDPDNINATHVPIRPVVAPAHDGAS